MRQKKIIYTIGHSNRTTREFIKILKAFEIEKLVDIRHYPGSRHVPQFGKARLRQNLLRNNIGYQHIEDLGGRRRPDKSSHENSGWRSPQFRGYADYMQGSDFKVALKELISLAKNEKIVIMCAEAVPWRCHRSLVSDALMVNGFEVMDLFSEKVVKPHKLISFAHVVGKKITYPEITSNENV